MRLHLQSVRSGFAAAVVLFSLILGVPAIAAGKGPRLALVITNGAYQNFDKLGSTYNDGDKIVGALNATGFTDASGTGVVQVRRDLTLDEMIAAVAQFRAALNAAGPEAFGVLYFSGHGAALGSFGDVMLVPIDATRNVTVEGRQMTRAQLTKTLLGSGAKNLLIVLDMCRNVLAVPSMMASAAAPIAVEAGGVGDVVGSKGLQRLVRQSDSPARPDQGYLVAFSTSPDQFAFDDGTFSKVLAEEIRRPQQNIADALKRTSDRVALKAGKTFQKPTFDYGLQGAPPCFVTCDANNQDRFYDCANCPYMRVVPAGTATIGSPTTEPSRARNEPVQAEVAIAKPFAVGVYEVTIAEWMACVRDKACRPISDWSKENPNPQIPATGISYADAQAFVAWLSVQSGLAYRMPTEEEWEYADRAGSATIFPWGDDITPSAANYDQTASYRGSPKAPYRGYPEAVNAYPPNSFGLYQMQGNVWEWSSGCTDQSCKTRIARGGSFQSVPSELRAANRFAVADGKKRDDVGLRVARDVSPDEVLR